MSQDILSTLVAQRDRFLAAARAMDAAIEAVSSIGDVQLPAVGKGKGTTRSEVVLTPSERPARGKSKTTGTTKAGTPKAKSTGSAGKGKRIKSEDAQNLALDVIARSDEGATINDVSDALKGTMNPPAVRRAMGALEDAGLIANVNPGQKRNARFKVTESGATKRSEPTETETETETPEAAVESTNGSGDVDNVASFGGETPEETAVQDPTLEAETEPATEVDEVHF